MQGGPLLSPNVVQHNKKYPLQLRRYASGQYLASLSYWLAEQKKLPSSVLVLNSDGAYQNYTVKEIPLKPGMYAYILVPQNTDLKDIKVLFRGTDFSDLSSININLETWGPGSLSFVQEKENIFACVKKTIADAYPAGTKIKLEVAGHSQGAALNLLFSGELLARRCSSQDYDDITQLEITCLNTPGVASGYAKCADDAVLRLAAMGKKLCPIINFGMVGGDPVQISGADMPFARLPNDLAEVNLLFLDREFEGLWLTGLTYGNGLLDYKEWWALLTNPIKSLYGAHPSGNFSSLIDKEGKIYLDCPYRLFSNKKADDIANMQSELLNKSYYARITLFPLKVAAYYGLCFVDNNIKRSSKIYQAITGYLSRGKTVGPLEQPIILTQPQPTNQSPLPEKSNPYLVAYTNQSMPKPIEKNPELNWQLIQDFCNLP